MPQALPAIAAIASIASTGYSIYSSETQRAKAHDVEESMKGKAAGAVEAAKQKEKEMERQIGSTWDVARARSLASQQAPAGAGFGGNLLTGVPRKTLLGS